MLQSMGLQRFGHNWATGQEQLLFMYNRPTTGALTCARFEQLCSDMRQGFKHSTGCNRGISLATMLPLSRNLRSRLCPLDLPPHPATPEAGSVLCICCLTPHPATLRSRLCPLHLLPAPPSRPATPRSRLCPLHLLPDPWNQWSWVVCF